MVDDPLVVTRPLTAEELEARRPVAERDLVVYAFRSRPVRIVWMERDGSIVAETTVSHR